MNIFHETSMQMSSERDFYRVLVFMKALAHKFL